LSESQSGARQKDVKISSVETRLHQIDTELSSLQSDLADLQAQLDSIRSSLPWRAAGKLNHFAATLLPLGTRRRSLVRRTLKAIVRPTTTM
jgi:septal ring factor EnvC (AmiA/AmiB activator)